MGTHTLRVRDFPRDLLRSTEQHTYFLIKVLRQVTSASASAKEQGDGVLLLAPGAMPFGYAPGEVLVGSVNHTHTHTHPGNGGLR